MRRSGSGALVEGHLPDAAVSAAKAMPPPLPLQGTRDPPGVDSGGDGARPLRDAREALGGDGEGGSVEGGTPRSGRAEKAEKRAKGEKKDKDRKKKDRKKKERCVAAIIWGTELPHNTKWRNMVLLCTSVVVCL